MAHDSTFRSAIPGSSLTREPKSLPSDQPPEFTDKNEALAYIWKQMHQTNILKQIWLIAEQGGTIWAMTRAILYRAALSGIIQMNLAVVLAPTVSKMLYTIIKSKGIEPKITPKFKSKTKDTMLKMNMQKSMKKAQQPKPAPKEPPAPLPPSPVGLLQQASQSNTSTQPSGGSQQ